VDECSKCPRFRGVRGRWLSLRVLEPIRNAPFPPPVSGVLFFGVSFSERCVAFTGPKAMSQPDLSEKNSEPAALLGKARDRGFCDVANSQRNPNAMRWSAQSRGMAFSSLAERRGQQRPRPGLPSPSVSRTGVSRWSPHFPALAAASYERMAERNADRSDRDLSRPLTGYSPLATRFEHRDDVAATSEPPASNPL
jgi:hypothetical protein